MISRLEMMEAEARFDRFSSLGVTNFDTLTVKFFRGWLPEFYYFHNGVAIDRDRALELIPFEPN